MNKPPTKIFWNGHHTCTMRVTNDVIELATINSDQWLDASVVDKANDRHLHDDNAYKCAVKKGIRELTKEIQKCNSQCSE